MPKANKKAQCEPHTSDTVPPEEETNFEQGSESEQAWSGDLGIDQIISWDLSPEETSLEVIWQKFEEFCKPQTNEIRARFDLLTSFKQGDQSVDEWCNAVQGQINLAK